MSWCKSLWVYPPWNWLIFLDVYIHVFPQTWELLERDFFKYFICPFYLSSSLELLKWECWWLWWCPTDCSFLFILFFLLLFRLDNFKFTNPFFCLLKSDTEPLYWVFSWSYCTQLENLFGLLLKFLCLYWYSHVFLTSFSLFPLVLCPRFPLNSLYIFQRLDLASLTNKSNI